MVEDYKDYFKTQKEVYEFFEVEVFKFHFMMDNIMTFQTLNPIFIGSELANFNICFYYESGRDFFCYSSFHDFLDNFKISSVELCDYGNKNESVIMYSSKFQ